MLPHFHGIYVNDSSESCIAAFPSPKNYLTAFMYATNATSLVAIPISSK